MNGAPGGTVNVPGGVALEIPLQTHADTLDAIHSGTASSGITTCIDRLCTAGPAAQVASRG